MIQQQNKKSSVLKISGINLQAKSTREFLYLQLQMFGEKPPDGKNCQEQESGLLLLSGHVSNCTTIPCYRYYYVNLKSFL